MTTNEATARIKINRLLDAAGWRFFAERGKPANICLEQSDEKGTVTFLRVLSRATLCAIGSARKSAVVS